MRTSAKGNDAIKPESYSDADLAADKGDRKSLTETMVLVNGMPASWAPKKQGVVSLSTVEAEFVSALETDREIFGIREMLMEVGLSLTLPMIMHEDNQAAIRQIEGEASSLKAKHIDVQLTFVKDFARCGILEQR